MKRILLFSILALVASFGFAQSASKAKSCSIADKKACGPTNTKVSEARIITELRDDATAFMVGRGLAEEIAQGKNDDESFEILVQELRKISKEVNIDFPALRGSKARKVATLRNWIAENGG